MITSVLRIARRHWNDGTRKVQSSMCTDENVCPQFRVLPGAKLIFMPQQGSANSLYDSVLDDHDGGDSAGVASGFDPSGGNPMYQFGTDWDP